MHTEKLELNLPNIVQQVQESCQHLEHVSNSRPERSFYISFFNGSLSNVGAIKYVLMYTTLILNESMQLTMAERKENLRTEPFKPSRRLFTDIAGRAVCLISGADVAVIKEYNLRWHHKTQQQDKLQNLNAEKKQWHKCKENEI